MTDHRLRTLVLGLPKAELHVHLEGTLGPATALTCARRNGVALPWETEEELAAAYRFDGLTDFLGVFFRVVGTLRQPKDFHELALDYLQHAQDDGVREAEIFFGAQTFLDAGVRIGSMLEPILDAFLEAERQWGIQARLICTAQRHRDEASGLELLDLLEPWRPSIVGVGLGSAELGNPPSKFARYFAEARRRGYRTTIHAGEDGPASYVEEALNLGVDRIDHGTAAIQDPKLVTRLADTGIPLTMCPLSNVALKVVPKLSDHPLKKLLDAGVLVTINSDDPPFFGGYLAENYLATAEALDLTEKELRTLAENSMRACWPPS